MGEGQVKVRVRGRGRARVRICASSRVGASTSPRTAGTPPSEAGAPG